MRGRHLGFPSFDVLAGGPANLPSDEWDWTQARSASDGCRSPVARAPGLCPIAMFTQKAQNSFSVSMPDERGRLSPSLARRANIRRLPVCITMGTLLLRRGKW